MHSCKPRLSELEESRPDCRPATGSRYNCRNNSDCDNNALLRYRTSALAPLLSRVNAAELVCSLSLSLSVFCENKLTSRLILCSDNGAKNTDFTPDLNTIPREKLMIRLERDSA